MAISQFRSPINYTPVSAIQKIIVLVVVHHIIISETKNCIEMYENCDRARNNCKLDIIIMKKMCGDFLYDASIFNGCDRGSELNCKAAIKTLRTKHDLGDCTCENDYISYAKDQRLCDSIWRMLHAHPCYIEPPLYLPKSGNSIGNSKTKQQSPTEIELDKISTDKNDKELFPNSEYNAIMLNSLRVTLGSLGLFSEINSPKSSSCLVRQQMCIQDHNCNNAWNSFKSQCQFQTCDKTGDQCVASYQDLRQFGLFECICVPFHQFQTANIKACLEIQTNLMDNKCLAFLNNRVMYQTLTFTATDSNRNADSAMETSLKHLQSVTSETPNCLASYQLCIQSSQCLQRYMEVEKHCSLCNDKTKCLRAVRFFRQKPDIVSLNSVRCQCEHSSINDSCHRQHKVFQPTCITKSPQPITNCLHLMLQCLNDTTCLDSFTVFSELCTPRYNDSLVCPSNYLRCLDAYRTIWGSVLTSECSCDTVETNNIAAGKYLWAQNPMHICQFFKTLLSRLYCIFPDERYRRKTNAKLSSKIDVKAENDPCYIISKHNLPSNGLIRIDSASSCPLICKCGKSCQTIPCSSRTNSSRPICKLFNLSETVCNCSAKIIKCLPHKSDNANGMYKDSGYKIMIQYNEHELNQIRNMNLIPGMHSILFSLNHIMTMSTGLKHCHLMFEEVHNRYLTFILQIYVQRKSIINQRFATRYWSQSDDDRLGHLTAECVLSVKLLQLMINRNYPEIQHSLPLSILQKAEIIVPPQMSLLPAESVKSPHLGSPTNSFTDLTTTITVILACQAVLSLS